MHSFLKLVRLAVISSLGITAAQADIVEPFTGGQLSAPGWSTGIGADASNYLASPAPDGTYGLYLAEGVWSYNTNIAFNAGDTLSAWINPGPSATVDNNAQGGRIFLGFDAGASGAYSFAAASDTNQLGFADNSTAYNTSDFSNSVTQNYQDQWYRLSISLSADGTSATASLFDIYGALLSSLTETGLNPSPNNGIALYGVGGAVVSSISIVPVPGAVWLFGTAISGLLFGMKRRQAV